MTNDLEKYEQSIKRKHSFAWNPKFEEEFHTNLSKTLVLAITIKTFEKLEWDIVYQDEESVEAKRKDRGIKWTEKITVSYHYGRVKVRSVSLDGVWDFGRNSLRVKLFIHAFAEIEKEFDKTALAELEKETKRKNNLDDYEIPTELPQPRKSKKPNVWIPAAGATLIALLLGYALASLAVEGIYLLFFFEFLVGFALAFAFKYLVKLSNYADFSKLKLILIGSIITVYASNQYFQYQIIMERYADADFSIGFFEFMKIRLEQGIRFRSLDTGWIGLIAVWVIQLVFTYWFSMIRFPANLIKFQLERIPPEVVNFTYYHFVKGKNEEQIRAELSKMGWTEKLNQDEVFISLSALEATIDFNR